MAEPYTFEYEGVAVEFDRGTVRSGIEARQIVVKLLRSHGYVDGNLAPDSEYALFDEFASVMSRSKTEAAWWAHSNMSEDETRQRFEAFMEQDESLYINFRNAASATRPEKKISTVKT